MWYDGSSIVLAWTYSLYFVQIGFGNVQSVTSTCFNWTICVDIGPKVWLTLLPLLWGSLWSHKHTAQQWPCVLTAISTNGSHSLFIWQPCQPIASVWWLIDSCVSQSLSFLCRRWWWRWAWTASWPATLPSLRSSTILLVSGAEKAHLKEHQVAFLLTSFLLLWLIDVFTFPVNFKLKCSNINGQKCS